MKIRVNGISNIHFQQTTVCRLPYMSSVLSSNGSRNIRKFFQELKTVRCLSLQDYKDNPPHLPTETSEEIEKETVKLREALEKKLGLLDDFEKLFYNGFCTRHKLATLEQTDIKRLVLVGTLEQYESVFAPNVVEVLRPRLIRVCSPKL